jgi:cytochrome c-type biogenesis protein CcmH
MVHRARLAVAPLFLAGTLVFANSLAVRAATAEGAPGEARLEARLMAPCCWTQTLDMHESELASYLRREVRRRLLAGDTPEAIEDDLAARYGEQIRVAGKGREIGGPVPLVVGLGTLAAAGALFALMRHWVRAEAARAHAPRLNDPARLGAADNDPYDAILDDELRQLDE